MSKDKKKDLRIPDHFIPRDYQVPALREFFSGRSKRLLFWVCRRGGKDLLSFAITIRAAFDTVGSYFYLLPEKEQAKKVIWNASRNDRVFFMDMIPKDIIHKKNEQEKWVQILDADGNPGSIIYILGTKDYDALRGTNPIGVVISEAADHHPNLLPEIIDPILGINGGWLIVNGTPKGPNWYYKLYQHAKGDPKWCVIEAQCYSKDWPNYQGEAIFQDNPDTTAEEYMEYQREMGKPEHILQQEYGCSATASVTGSFYGDLIQKAKAENRVGNFVPTDQKWVDTYWDLGLSDDHVCWFVQRDGNRIILIDYLETRQKSPAEIVEILKNKGYKYRTHYLPHDGRNTNRGKDILRTTQDLFRECLIEARISDDIQIVPKLPIQSGIDSTRNKFSQFYFNLPLVEKGLEHLELYHRRYDSKLSVFMKEPAKTGHNHAADALRMLGVTEEYEPYEYQVNESLNVESDFNVWGDIK